MRRIASSLATRTAWRQARATALASAGGLVAAVAFLMAQGVHATGFDVLSVAAVLALLLGLAWAGSRRSLEAS